ncbi:1,4-dihydroxy-2-naphthoate polyprenyltransferase [Enhygromyxa salina]|uniref:1,4-dihydroxy-2-naphthoate polyprenyltransferase n=1 Tax=Enhygromyxa salina TaxID=215803 RepID=A0A0C1ZKK1_9BACT|nr:prenyltransferase [Enhygromyxa salina]KIG18044.1 1,4-dihydroxy-2-naphthoate polyprenyltransferase [Enhygromyxa salina]
MHPASRSLIGRWTYAAKLDSWPKLLVPMLFGQALGVAAAGQLNPLAFGLGLAITLCELLFVVFLNDWGDRRVDRIKRQMFPDDCSPKTIPDEILPASAVLTAGVIAGLAVVGAAFVAEHLLARPGLGWAALGLQTLFLAYSFAPLRLNYRGGGEWLEGLGVGLALPCFHLFLQSGASVWVRELWLVPGFFLLAIASAVASGLADEQSDRRGGKRTYASEYGNRAARALVERLVLAACLIWAVSMRISGAVPAPIGALAVIVILVNWRRLRAVSPEAKTNAFVAQRRYKHFLHQAQWRSAALISVALIALTMIGSCGGWRG